MVADAHGSDEAVLDRRLDFALPAMLCQALKVRGKVCHCVRRGYGFRIRPADLTEFFFCAQVVNISAVVVHSQATVIPVFAPASAKIGVRKSSECNYASLRPQT